MLAIEIEIVTAMVIQMIVEGESGGGDGGGGR